MKYYSIHEFSKLIGRTPQTLRNWDASGRLHPHHTGAGGYRYYSHQQLNEVLGITDKSRKVIGNSKEISKIVVFYKDRLLHFGFELVEYMANLNGCGIEVLDSTEKTEQEELIEDLIQIVTVFSCRLQGKRADKTHRLVDELLEESGVTE